jgi:DNA-binding IclR family transcriptional regulator
MRVLHLVCEAPQQLSLNDLAVLAALPRMTVFRYLRSFLAMRMAEHDASTNSYRAGLGPVVAFARRKSLQASSPNLPSDLEAPQQRLNDTK